jgi:cob(I)alamin adenosyltransferase
MKIYTQTGDEGKTSLLSGERVPKNHVRIKAYGEVDELNSMIGVQVAVLTPGLETVSAQLQQIQSDLFHAGAWLSVASDSDAFDRLTPIGLDHTLRIESMIDELEAGLPSLRAFILPGGALPAAWCHLVRAVCRRTERAVLDLLAEERGHGSSGNGIDGILMYLNRLSDFFFVLARFLNDRAGVGDQLWQQGAAGAIK